MENVPNRGEKEKVEHSPLPVRSSEPNMGTMTQSGLQPNRLDQLPDFTLRIKSSLLPGSSQQNQETVVVCWRCLWIQSSALASPA